MVALRMGFMSALLMSFSFAVFIQTGDAWRYNDPEGVDSWAEQYSESCAGKFQSPIDLTPSAITKDDTLGPFTFTNFDTTNGVQQELINNGHSAVVKYVSGDLRVCGGGLKDVYRVAQFHFHWGSDDTKGSEHTVNGVHYPLEMHIVTYNTNYSTFANALKYPDGLAVLGVFFKVKRRDNYAYSFITDALPSVTYPDSSMKLTPTSLARLLPKNTRHYYRYHGSLTTPPCNEVVIWTVFKKPVSISKDQMEAFRGLLSNETDAESGELLPMVDNFRPTQPLNGREVTTSY